jgi:hypothetical protein
MARKARKSGRIATQAKRLINMENQCLEVAVRAGFEPPVWRQDFLVNFKHLAGALTPQRTREPGKLSDHPAITVMILLAWPVPAPHPA